MSLRPDFACVAPPYLEQRDLLFLFENFPVAGTDPVAAAQRVIEQPNTLESLLESQYVYDAIRDNRCLFLDISPKLFFNVLLRRCLPTPRSADDRRAIHYLANLLATFIHTDRLFSIAPDQDESFSYLADLAAAETGNEHHDFLVHSHIGNLAMFLSGYHAAWIEHRHRYKRRPLTLDYYRDMGSIYYGRAAGHRLAAEFEIDDVLAHLAGRFEYFRHGLQDLASAAIH